MEVADLLATVEEMAPKVPKGTTVATAVTALTVQTECVEVTAARVETALLHHPSLSLVGLFFFFLLINTSILFLCV